MVYQELKEYCQDSVCFFPSLVFLCLALFSGKLSAFGNRMLPAHIFSVILVGRGKRISFPIVPTNLLEVSLMGLAWVMCPFLNQSQWSWWRDAVIGWARFIYCASTGIRMEGRVLSKPHGVRLEAESLPQEDRETHTEKKSQPLIFLLIPMDFFKNKLLI